MQNLTIVNNDIKSIQKILRNTSASITNLKLYNFFISSDENIYSSIIDNNTDILILEYNKVGLKILDYIEKNNISSYKKSIIILYHDINNVKELLGTNLEYYIFKCIKISNNINPLINALRKLVYIKENTYEETILSQKIGKYLSKIGYDLNNVGTKYIIEIIEFLHKNNIQEFKLNEVYTLLSQKHNKSFNTIKGNVRSSTEIMRLHGNPNIISDFFNYLDLSKYPSPKEIICTINEKLYSERSFQLLNSSEYSQNKNARFL